MTLGTRERGAACAGVQYFGSFSGYGPELTPVDPITFEETQQTAGFMEVERELGLVAVLRSIGVTRSSGPVSHGLEETRPPGTELVFEAVFDPRIDEHLVGSEIAYNSTRSAHVFFAGKVGADGRTVALRLFRRAVVFCEVYDHDATGRLVTALHFTADTLPRVELFGDGESPLPLADRYTGARDVGCEARVRAEELRRRAKQRFGEKDYQPAIADLEAALALVEGDNEESDATLANVLCNLGTGWLHLKDFSRATYFAACGLELHARRRSIRGVGVCTVTLGSVFQYRNLAALAMECHSQAARFFLKAGDSESREYALEQLHTIECWHSNTPD